MSHRACRVVRGTLGRAEELSTVGSGEAVGRMTSPNRTLKATERTLGFALR